MEASRNDLVEGGLKNAGRKERESSPTARPPSSCIVLRRMTSIPFPELLEDEMFGRRLSSRGWFAVGFPHAYQLRKACRPLSARHRNRPADGQCAMSVKLREI